MVWSRPMQMVGNSLLTKFEKLVMQVQAPNSCIDVTLIAIIVKCNCI